MTTRYFKSTSNLTANIQYGPGQVNANILTNGIPASGPDFVLEEQGGQVGYPWGLRLTHNSSDGKTYGSLFGSSGQVSHSVWSEAWRSQPYGYYSETNEIDIIDTYNNGEPLPSHPDLLPPVIVDSVTPEPGNLGFEGDLFRVVGSGLGDDLEFSFYGVGSSGDLQVATPSLLSNVNEDGTEGFLIVPTWDRIADTLPIFTDVESVEVRYETQAWSNDFSYPYSYIPNDNTLDYFNPQLGIETVFDIPTEGFNVLYSSPDNDSSINFTIPSDALTLVDGVINFAGNMWDYVSSAFDEFGQEITENLNPFNIVEKTGNILDRIWDVSVQSVNDGYEIATGLKSTTPTTVLDDTLASDLDGSEVQVFHPLSVIEQQATVENNTEVDACCKLTNLNNLFLLKKYMEMQWMFYKLAKQQNEILKSGLNNKQGGSTIVDHALFRAMTYGKTEVIDQEFIRLITDSNGVRHIPNLVDLFNG
jgi:hypothetical protein